MQDVLAKARAASATRATVLLLGESGTGKEVIAQAIHRMSPQRDQPFVPVHCGAIPDNLIESELFGYTKGAFTDARKDAPGKFREALRTLGIRARRMRVRAFPVPLVRGMRSLSKLRQATWATGSIGTATFPFRSRSGPCVATPASGVSLRPNNSG